MEILVTLLVFAVGGLIFLGWLYFQEHSKAQELEAGRLNFDLEVSRATQKLVEENNQKVFGLHEQNAQLGQENSKLNEGYVQLYQNYQNLSESLNQVRLEKEEIWNSIPSLIEKERADAIKSSKSVIGGFVGEQFAPWMSEFEYRPQDCKFLGSPLDYIVFSGMNSGEVKEIVFIDIKSGSAQLTQRQKDIQRAVEDGKVRFEVFRMDFKENE